MMDISEHTGLVYTILNKHYHWAVRKMGEDEAFQVALIGAWKASKNFDNSRGNCWPSHARLWIRAELQHSIWKSQAIRVPLHKFRAGLRVPCRTSDKMELRPQDGGDGSDSTSDYCSFLEASCLLLRQDMRSLRRTLSELKELRRLKRGRPNMYQGRIWTAWVAFFKNMNSWQSDHPMTGFQALRRCSRIIK